MRIFFYAGITSEEYQFQGNNRRHDNDGIVFASGSVFLGLRNARGYAQLSISLALNR